MIWIRIVDAVVAQVPHTIPVNVSLARVGQKRTVVKVVVNAVVVRVVVTCIPDTVAISVLLTGVGVAGAVVHGAGGLRAAEAHVRPAVVVIVGATKMTGTNISGVTLAETTRVLG